MFCCVALLCVCLFASLLVSTVTYVVGYLARLFCSLEIWLVDQKYNRIEGVLKGFDEYACGELLFLKYNVM